MAWAGLRIPGKARRRVSAEDLAQEVWLRAVRIYEQSFDPSRSSPRAWLFAVAKNILLELQRVTMRDREHPAEGRTSRYQHLAEVPADVTSTTSRVSRDEGVRNFVARVEAMAEDDRKLLLYCGMEGLTLREAAERLGIEHEAAGKRWQRLRTVLLQWPACRNLMAL